MKQGQLLRTDQISATKAERYAEYREDEKVAF